MAALISSKLNQWTLLLGSLPLVFSASTGTVTELPLEGRQQLELFLTAAQSLFAVLLFTNLKLTVRGAFALMVLFLVQAVLPFDSVRLAVGILYLILSAGLIFLRRNDIKSRAKEFLREARGQTQG